MTYNSHIYLLIFLIIRINSAKNAVSTIFELKSMAKPQNHVSDVIGLYQASNETSNNFVAYKRLGTEMYIFVTRNGFWAVNKKLPPNTKVLYKSKNSNETINEEPPATGWQYRKTKKEDWKDDETIQWTKFDCCDEINLVTESKSGGIKSRQKSRLGKYRKSTKTAAGRFVYQQVDGDNFLYYVDQDGWYIANKVNAKSAGVRYLSPSSCPIGKPTTDPYWMLPGRYSGWNRDYKAAMECLIQNVSDKSCTIENSSTVNNVETCKFPFRFRGKVYDSCITDNNDPSKAWCSTGEEIEDGTYKYDDINWGYCQQDCTTKKTIPQNCMGSAKSEDLPMPLSAIIVLSAMTPLLVLLVIVLSVYAIRNLQCNCKCYKDREIVEQNPVYGLGDDDDAIEATDANSIYGDEDDEYENIENA